MSETKARYRVPLAPKQNEADFERDVLNLAHALGWRSYHTRYSLRSTAGYPDLTLCRPPRLVFAELKREGFTASEAQAEWLAALGACAGVEAYLWTPADVDAIALVLR